jgi:exoribonuclease II
METVDMKKTRRIPNHGVEGLMCAVIVCAVKDLRTTRKEYSAEVHRGTARSFFESSRLEYMVDMFDINISPSKIRRKLGVRRLEGV